MQRMPRISEAEWKVMKALWAKSPLTANEVIAALAGVCKWNDRTIRTLLTRLVRKNAIAHRNTGRSYQYHPLVGERQCVKEETRSFLLRVYDGSLMAMLLSLLNENELSVDQMSDVKRMLDKRRIRPNQCVSRSPKETRCRKCGYILRGIREPRCPGCGERI